MFSELYEWYMGFSRYKMVMVGFGLLVLYFSVAIGTFIVVDEYNISVDDNYTISSVSEIEEAVGFFENSMSDRQTTNTNTKVIYSVDQSRQGVDISVDSLGSADRLLIKSDGIVIESISKPRTETIYLARGTELQIVKETNNTQTTIKTIFITETYDGSYIL